MSWQQQTLKSTSDRKTFTILEGEQPTTYQRMLQLLGSSEPFRSFYNDLLASLPYPAFFWENPPVVASTLDQTYEYTIVNSPYLKNKSADTYTFSAYFSSARQAVSFDNLGGDARLIAPCPLDDQPAENGYAHIGRFVREAPDEQIQTFWQLVANEMLQAVGEEPRWLSTSGLGVFWLHARIDSHPKYYQTVEYKSL